MATDYVHTYVSLRLMAYLNQRHFAFETLLTYVLLLPMLNVEVKNTLPSAESVDVDLNSVAQLSTQQRG